MWWHCLVRAVSGSRSHMIVQPLVLVRKNTDYACFHILHSKQRSSHCGTICSLSWFQIHASLRLLNVFTVICKPRQKGSFIVQSDIILICHSFLLQQSKEKHTVFDIWLKSSHYFLTLHLTDNTCNWPKITSMQCKIGFNKEGTSKAVGLALICGFPTCTICWLYLRHSVVYAQWCRGCLSALLPEDWETCHCRLSPWWQSTLPPGRHTQPGPFIGDLTRTVCQGMSFCGLSQTFQLKLPDSLLSAGCLLHGLLNLSHLGSRPVKFPWGSHSRIFQNSFTNLCLDCQVAGDNFQPKKY